MPNRISKNEYYLKIASDVALRGTCLRRNYGAVIVKDDRIVSTGYTGAPRGSLNCCDIGTCHRQELHIPSGERYELCRSVHAEMNAIISASAEELKGSVLYLFGWEMKDGVPDRPVTVAEPCQLCKRCIVNAGIIAVVSKDFTASDNPIIKNELPGIWVGTDIV